MKLFTIRAIALCAFLLQTANPCKADSVLVSVDVPGLVATYDGWAPPEHHGSFDFGYGFLSITSAWLEIEGVAQSTAFYGISWTPGILIGPGNPFIPAGSFNISPSMNLAAAPLDGSGDIYLAMMHPTCCDHSTNVTKATLWFNAEVDPASVPVMSAVGQMALSSIVLIGGIVMSRRRRR